MKKTLLAIAVTALSANAFAADLDYTAANAPSANTIAKEVVTASAALTTTDVVSWKIGFSVTNQNLVRVDLSNGAKFTSAPSLTVDVTSVAAGAITGGTAAIISAGGAGQSFVVFQVANTGTVQFDKVAALKLNGLTTASQSDIAIQYRLYSDQSAAALGTSATLANSTFPYATFANGLVFTADATEAVASKQIDVTKGSKQFVSGLTSNDFGGLNLTVKANTYGADLTAPALGLSDFIGTTNAAVTVVGDFSAAANAASVKLGGVAANALNATKTEATFGVVALNKAPLSYTVNGTTVVAPSSYSAKLTLGTGAKLTSTPAEVTNFAALAKNGSTGYVDLALTPAGAYQNFVRITNKTNVAGNVYITLFNDAGKSVSFPLSAVAGQSASLEAQASTAQLNINEIYAAAKATDATFSVVDGRNKLRLVVDGEFAGNGNNSISVQSYTVSKDNNSFATF